MKNHGAYIYLDKSTNGERKKRKNVYRAEIFINGKRYRKRNKDKAVLEKWLEAMKENKNEVIRSSAEKIKWHGWSEESGVSKVDFFNNEKIACKCFIPCENCGFFYLDDKGNNLEKPNKPLCGEW